MSATGLIFPWHSFIHRAGSPLTSQWGIKTPPLTPFSLSSPIKKVPDPNAINLSCNSLLLHAVT
jgi:hypothetical protein